MIDQSRDLGGRELYRLTQLYSPPAFVKNASTAAMCGEGEMPAHLYADPRNKLYPMHTPAATWASTAFFVDKAAELKPTVAAAIEERLNAMANFHNIVGEIQTLRQKMAAAKPFEEDQLPDEDFALVNQDANGVKHRHYPLRNTGEVKAAADYVMKWRDKMPYHARREMADRILQKAAQTGAALGELTGELEKQAGYGAGTAAEAAECILNRVQASRHGTKLSDVQTELLKLAHTLATKPAQLYEPGARCKTAALVDAFDRSHHLTAAIKDGGLPRIEDVLFGVTQEKMASVASGHCATITGNIYKLASLEQLKLRDVRAELGNDLAEAFSKDGIHVDCEKAAEVVATLPRGDAAAFDQLMSKAGLSAIAKEASSQALGASHAYLQEMAARLRQSESQQ